MPLLHKPPLAQSEQPATASVDPDAKALLAQLFDLVAHKDTASGRSRASRRLAEARYDRVVRLLATGIGLFVCAAAWLVGAYFTLAWLASLGFTWATAGIAPLTAVVQGTSVTAKPYDGGPINSSLAALAWLIPLGLTFAEIGFDPGRASGGASRLLWGAFLIADATTSALGLYSALANALSSWPIAATLATLIGLALALVPEKLARRLIRKISEEITYAP